MPGSTGGVPSGRANYYTTRTPTGGRSSGSAYHYATPPLSTLPSLPLLTSRIGSGRVDTKQTQSSDVEVGRMEQAVKVADVSLTRNVSAFSQKLLPVIGSMTPSTIN